MLHNLSFSEALDALKKNSKDATLPTIKIAREGWNGKGMWLSYCDPYNNKQFTLVEKAIEGTCSPYIGMKTFKALK